MQNVYSSAVSLGKAVLALLCGCLFAMSVTEPAFAKPSYVVKAPQSWVRALDLESEKTGPASASSTFLLDDHQVRVGEKTVERYYHHVQKIDTAAGLNDVSQLRFTFEPSFQQLAIHFIRIRRQGTVIDAMKLSEIKVISQEEELNQQLYNGTLAAIAFLNDIRVGDIVDYAYTVSGENPVLNGRFADTLYLADQQPIRHLNFRLILPSSRSVAIKKANIEIEPRVQASGSDTEYIWERREVGAVNVEDYSPAWHNPYPSVSLSEFRTWTDVVQWALPMYRPGGAIPAELNAKIQKWQAESQSPEARTVAALRFVQDEIRYLGIELGRYSHQPTAPAKVFDRRFGDCKDKSLLLATILNAMGIDAAPALVNSTTGRSLDQQQPSPFAFDHVIVQVKIGGKSYWLDPTISYQRGSLDKYYDPPYERALALRDSGNELEKIPLPAVGSGHILISEKFERKVPGGPVSLLVNSIYSGAEADNIRYSLASTTMSDVGKASLNFYNESNSSIKADGLPQVEDDENKNTIVIREKYLIDGFWKDNKHYFIADKIYSELRQPDVKQRTMPLRMRYPISIDQTVEINLKERFDLREENGTIGNEALRFTYGFDTHGNDIKLSYSFKTLADFVPVEKVPKHLAVLDQIRNVVGFELTNDGSVATFSRSNQKGDWLTLLLVGIPLLAIVIVSLVRSGLRGRKPKEFAKALKSNPGFAPETAFRVSSEADIDPALREFKCVCGSHPYQPDSPPQRERFSYDGNLLVSTRLHCTACLRNSDLYFHPADRQSNIPDALPAG